MELLQSETQAGYNKIKADVDSFINEDIQRSHLESWIAWWHDRRGFLFRAFSPKDSPQMNQAEVVHASWAHRDKPNLSLLDACYADVRDALTLDVEMETYQAGISRGGTGPSYAARSQKSITNR